jgi:hypothetical protein
MTLVGHFFAVAIYGVVCMLYGPIYMLPWNIIKSIIVLYQACVIIFPLALAEIK